MKKTRVSLLCLLTLFVSGLFSYSVSAAIAPWSWSSGQYILIDNVTTTTSYNRAIDNAADRWRAVSGAAIYPIFKSSYSQYNEIHVSHAPSDINGFYGYALTYDSNGNFLEDYASGRAASGKIRVYSSKVDNLTTNQKTSVFLHEMGHILGLLHTSRASVMNKSTTLDYVYPTSYDKSELARKY